MRSCLLGQVSERTAETRSDQQMRPGLKSCEIYPDDTDRQFHYCAPTLSAGRPNFGYGDVNPRSNALGRYQMTRLALRATGMIDAGGSWTGKYGTHSDAGFLANQEAQEKALSDYLNGIDRQLRTNGSFDYLERQIDGIRARFTVTRAGLLAAAHREGALATREYLDKLRSVGFTSNAARLTSRDLRVETRLRTFATVPY